ncbi:MAG: DUF3147 family protein [Acidobacteriota bacterium]|nr:DUF3147 family protein [Acidobacteriota bacterium]MDE3170313.1 DUF3147 family protein [Acidobacteriota bacterium]
MSVRFQLSELRETSWTDFAVRFAFGGAITVLAGYIAKAYGPALGGLFLAFPAIFPATETLIERTEHERELQNGGLVKMRGRLSAAINARAAIWGSLGLVCFAAFVWKLLPIWNAAGTLLAALTVWIAASVAIWRCSRWVRFALSRNHRSPDVSG